MNAPVSQRALMLRLLAVAVAVVLVQAATGMTDLALYCTPLLLIATLLLSGRYPGESRALRAIVRARRPRPRRAIPQLRRPQAAERPLSSSLERSPLSRRGPPALAAA